MTGERNTCIDEHCFHDDVERAVPRSRGLCRLAWSPAGANFVFVDHWKPKMLGFWFLVEFRKLPWPTLNFFCGRRLTMQIFLPPHLATRFAWVRNFVEVFKSCHFISFLFIQQMWCICNRGHCRARIHRGMRCHVFQWVLLRKVPKSSHNRFGHTSIYEYFKF